MGTRLYVGNLPFSADEEQVRELFAQNGRNVVEVKLVMDRDTGRPRGFGFVEMGSSEEADGAIRDLNGRDYGGRPLTVNEARERTTSGGGGGGGYGGGGGRGGGGGYGGGGGRNGGGGGNRRY
jgi:RNA recognition motif-containing protein